MNKIRLLLAMAALALCAGRASAQGYVVVVNAANPVASLSKDKANNIFLKRVVKWDDGKPVVAINQDKSSKARDAFTRAVHGKAVTAVDSYWQQQIFAGKDAPPAERGSDADVLAFVRATPGAIGYVGAGTALGGDVKAVPIN
jgi:ABC-type phosphate transport system substrate-binding protein